MVEPFSDGDAVQERLHPKKTTLLFFTSTMCRPCQEQGLMMKETSGEPSNLTDIQYRYGNAVQILDLDITDGHSPNHKFFHRLATRIVEEKKWMIPPQQVGTPFNVFYRGTIPERAFPSALSKRTLFTELDRLMEHPCGTGCQIRRLFGNYRHR